MSLANPIPRGTRQVVPDYVSNGASLAFAFPFYLIDAQDLLVQVQQPNAVTFQTLVLGTDYTVTGTGQAGGATVTLALAPTAGALVRLIGKRIPSRTTSVVNNGAIQSGPFEQELDALELTAQEMRRDVDAAVSLANTAIAATPAGVAVSAAQAQLAATAAATSASAASTAATAAQTAASSIGGVRYDQAQSLNDAQKTQAWANLSFPAPSTFVAAATLTVGALARALRFGAAATAAATLGLPPVAGIANGWATGFVSNESAYALTIAAPAGVKLDGTTAGTAVLQPTQRGWFYLDADGYHSVLIPLPQAAVPASAVRQTVQAGPIASGAPAFLPATSASGTLTTQGLSATSPLVVSAAAGFGASGDINTVLRNTSALTWAVPLAQTITSATATATAVTFNTSAAHGLQPGSPIVVAGASQAAVNGSWVVASVPSATSYTITGTFTAGSVTGAAYTLTAFLAQNAATGATLAAVLPPIYQYGGTISTAAGQFTFDYQAMVGYLGNGTAAVATPLVFMGECISATTGVTSTLAYAYDGIYDSGWTATLPLGGAAITRQHALGLVPDRVVVTIECLTPDNGYAVGDRLKELSTFVTGSYLGAVTTWATRNSTGFVLGTGGTKGLLIINKTTGSAAYLTEANWRYKMLASRGW